MKLMTKLFIATSLFLSQVGFANTTSATPPESPTKHSQPIPSLSQTQNPDTVQTEKVQAAIVKTPALEGQNVTAAYLSGEVMLQGSVDTKEQEQAAIDAAKSVHGVTKVHSHLTIKGFSGS